MGRSRRFLPVLVLFFLIQRAAVGQQPLHWDATIESAKATASRSNKLVLVLFSAPWCTACHHLESDISNQAGAVAALEANFVPVKLNYDFYANTAKQFGVTRLPTTVILAPTPQGEVLAVIPERLPVDEYLSKLNKVAADAKRQAAGVFAQIQPGPPVGSPAAIGQSPPVGQSPVAGSAPPANPFRSAQAVAGPPSSAGPGQNPAVPLAAPAANLASALPGPSANAATADPRLAVAPGAGLSGSRPPDPQRPAENVQPSARPPVALDGFCPVQLAENSRWQPGKRSWGAIHRGRTYLFAGAEERRRFLADPDRYAPVSSGDDVVLLLEQGRSVSGYREHGLRFDGHVYLFAAEGTLEKFSSNPRYYAERALQALRPATQR